jgi:hypothetical protein
VILKRTSARRRLEPLLRRSWLAALLGSAALVALVGGATLWGIYYGMYLHKVKVANSLADFVDDVLETRLRIVPNLVSGVLGSTAERLTLDIKHTDFQRLAYKRELALERGLLLTSSDDFVPAEIRHADGTTRVKVRLKGDWVDHIAGEKWSFRVKVRGDDTIHGMKVFSLHHPGTRRFIYEWLYHRVLEREGIVPLRYEFVEVTVNGKNLGVYAMEEHFDKRLIEHNRRREGPILKFNEDLHWLDIDATGRRGAESATGIRGYRAGYVDTFRMGSLRGDPNLWKQFLTAASLLEAFRNGELATSRVFDTSMLATYFAVLDLMGAEHSASWINIRLYYNPVTSRLEPIGFDGNAGSPLRHLLGASDSLQAEGPAFRKAVFQDPVFSAAYVRALERLSQTSYLDALFEDIGEDLERNLKILYKEFPYLNFDKRILYRNQDVIRNALAPTKGLHAYYDGSGAEGFGLELANITVLPLEVLQVARGSMISKPARPVILRPSDASGNVEYEVAAFEVPAGSDWTDPAGGELEVVYRILGGSELRRAAVFPWPRQVPGLVESDLMRRPPNAEEFDFLEVDAAAGVIRIAEGSWTVDRDVIVPRGYRLRADGGTRLDLLDSALILSYSPLDFRGSSDHPIVVESSDGTGQGLLVLSAEARSRLAHVAFRNLTNPSRSGWSVTGAVTFYESPVDLENVEFAGNRSEDALNVVRSDFSIDRSLFRNTQSDAFDADFSDGVVGRSSFEEIGNDAIDVSGSRVSVSDVRITRAGDKGLSAGEHSDMTIHGVSVDGARIGVASKDYSAVISEEVRIRASQVGFAAYQKKSEFGPASIVARKTAFDDVGTPHLIENRSQLRLDGEDVSTSGEGIEAVIYGPTNG